MLSSKVQTPIFFRAPSTRRSSEYQAGTSRPSTTKSRNVQHKSLEEANLRIVQFEIAEREACKLIASLCLEGSAKLGIVGTEYEIDDILSGILVLGNLYKRIGNEKSGLEEVIERMKGEYKTMEADKNCMIERLENAILRLQMENNKLQENLTEMKLKHNHKMMIAMKEINEHRENLEAAKTEKGRLETKLQQQERKLMEVPRMEEQYQRNARSIVRQQEVANTLKEIGWKKLEGEVKSMNFWKSKAKSLEDIVSRQKAELDNLSNQGRLSLSRYQNLLLSYNSLKRLHPQDDVTMRTVLAQAHDADEAANGSNRGGGGVRPSTGNGRTADGNSKSSSTKNIDTSAKKRPISAPPGRSNAHNTSTINITDIGADGSGSGAHGAHKAQAHEPILPDDEALDELFHQHGHHTIGYRKQHHHRPTTAPSGRGASGGTGVGSGAGAGSGGGGKSGSVGASNRESKTNTPPLFKKTLHNIAAEELERLKNLVATKDEIITKLSRKLSHARAYPLKGINEPVRGYDSDDDHDFYSEEHKSNNNNTNSSKNVRFGGKPGEKVNTGLFDDDMSETASFIAQEEECHLKRVESAKSLQRHFNERSLKAKAAQPAHIRAIRAAKSFAESVTENLK